MWDGGNNIAEFKKINILYAETTQEKQLYPDFQSTWNRSDLTNITRPSFNRLLTAVAMPRKTHYVPRVTDAALTTLS